MEQTSNNNWTLWNKKACFKISESVQSYNNAERYLACRHLHENSNNFHLNVENETRSNFQNKKKIFDFNLCHRKRRIPPSSAASVLVLNSYSHSHSNNFISFCIFILYVSRSFIWGYVTISSIFRRGYLYGHTVFSPLWNITKPLVCEQTKG